MVKYKKIIVSNWWKGGKFDYETELQVGCNNIKG